MLLNLKEQTYNFDQKQHTLQNGVQRRVNMKRMPGEIKPNLNLYSETGAFVEKRLFYILNAFIRWDSRMRS